MGALAAVAEEAGVILLHENEKDIYGDIPARCLDIVDLGRLAATAGWPGIRPTSSRSASSPFTEGYAMLRPHVGYMQIKDAAARRRRGGRRRCGRRRGRGDDPRPARRRLRRLLLPRAAPRGDTSSAALSGPELFTQAWKAFTDMLTAKGSVRMSTPTDRPPSRSLALVGVGVIGTPPWPGDQRAGRSGRAGRRRRRRPRAGRGSWPAERGGKAFTR